MTDSSPLNFEKAFTRLEELLEKMNVGSLSLEESLSFYEEADKLIQFCQKQLTEAETKIEILVKNREGETQLTDSGAPLLQSFTQNASSLSRFS